MDTGQHASYFRKRDILKLHIKELVSKIEQTQGILRVLSNHGLTIELLDLQDDDVSAEESAPAVEEVKSSTKRQRQLDDIEAKYSCLKIHTNEFAYYISDWVGSDRCHKKTHHDGMCFWRAPKCISKVCVYVTGISATVSRLRFLERMELFGQVIGIHVVIKSHSRRPVPSYTYAGYAYVQYANPQHAEELLDRLGSKPSPFGPEEAWLDHKYLRAFQSQFEMDIDRMRGPAWNVCSPRVSLNPVSLHSSDFGWGCLPDEIPYVVGFADPPVT